MFGCGQNRVLAIEDLNRYFIVNTIIHPFFTQLIVEVPAQFLIERHICSGASRRPVFCALICVECCFYDRPSCEKIRRQTTLHLYQVKCQFGRHSL